MLIQLIRQLLPDSRRSTQSRVVFHVQPVQQQHFSSLLTLYQPLKYNNIRKSLFYSISVHRSIRYRARIPNSNSGGNTRVYRFQWTISSGSTVISGESVFSGINSIQYPQLTNLLDQALVGSIRPTSQQSFRSQAVSIVDEIISSTDFQVMHTYINSLANSALINRLSRVQLSQVEWDKVHTCLCNNKPIQATSHI